MATNERDKLPKRQRFARTAVERKKEKCLCMRNAVRPSTLTLSVIGANTVVIPYICMYVHNSSFILLFRPPQCHNSLYRLIFNLCKFHVCSGVDGCDLRV
ncbi:unnamed protein product [Ceratitis capitata]|uniref:(Mediterranean fruit fly) hypothetical protein n=1 Tax=Ceratitis capitata TaxID=7213 RepID=A0A811TYG3_CERCA|nr:unnamed protein product [Ceratitis capitata]